jgi:RNA binding exosome subunit
VFQLQVMVNQQHGEQDHEVEDREAKGFHGNAIVP